jgi:flagellar basal-body rod modification protein FlgD
MLTTATANQSTQALLDSVNGTQKKVTSKTEDMQNRFLKLLTTQLKNQDPLNPMDNAQMTSQMAQISTVDGVERLNATLQKMMNSSTEAEGMQAAALVGHQVMVQGSALSLTDSGAVGGVELTGNADQVVVTVKDWNGQTVRTLNLGSLDAGSHSFAWDGKSDGGAQAVNGNYSIAVDAKQASNKVDAKLLELANVISVNRSTQGVSLDLGTKGLVKMTDIKQIF